jgi:predicted GH43/DUF377 family glycosyl hydrolase
MDKRKKTIAAAVILSSIAATLLLASLVYFRLPVQGQQASIVFSAAGDYGTNAESWAVIGSTGSNFHLALGDFSYSSPGGWCGAFRNTAGLSPVIVSGNHDDGDIDVYAAECSFSNALPGISLTGTYASGTYYFDYPVANPLIRVIMGTAGVFSTDQTFVQSAIRSAKALGIPWTAYGSHKVCIEPTGDKSCEIGQGFLDMLFAEKIDIILQAHAHTYSRSHQLTCGNSGSFVSSCVADSDGQFTKGAGTVIVIQGIGGQSIRSSGWGDSDSNYFATTKGGDGCSGNIPNCPSSDFGTVQYTITAASLQAKAILQGNQIFDPWSISSDGSLPPPSLPPTASRHLIFVKDPTGPLLLGHTEPDVIKVGETYYLYNRANGHIQLATSTDGVTWTDAGSILTASASGWDSAEVINPSVLLDNGVYYLYYEADDASNPGNRAVGLATSTSPTGPFTKHSGNPVLTPTISWEGTIVGTPVISKTGTNYFLFYHGYSGGSDRAGVAYSSGPTGPWTKEVNNPILDIGPPDAWDDGKVAPSSVYFPGSEVWLFYEGFDGTNAATQTTWRIGMANGTVDSDGRIKSLSKDPVPILDIGSQGAWDYNAVQLPSILFTGTEFWMYYSGHDGSAYRLGRAVSQVPTPPPTEDPCFLCGFLPTIFSSIGWLLLAGLVIGLAITLAIFKARSRAHRRNLGNRAMPSSPVSEPSHDSRLDEAFRQGKVSRGTYLRVRKRRRSTN